MKKKYLTPLLISASSMLCGGLMMLLATNTINLSDFRQMALSSSQPTVEQSETVFSTQSLPVEVAELLSEPEPALIPPKPQPDICQTQSVVPVRECNFLRDLYAATAGAGWTTNSGWMQDQDVCSRYGVTCQAGSIVAIDLSDNNLQGWINDSITVLKNLSILDLSGNVGLQGPLNFIASMPKLTKVIIQESSFCGRLHPAVVERLETDDTFRLFATNNNLILDHADKNRNPIIGVQGYPSVCER